MIDVALSAYPEEEQYPSSLAFLSWRRGHLWSRVHTHVLPSMTGCPGETPRAACLLGICTLVGLHRCHGSPGLHTRFGPSLLAPVLLCVGLFRLTLREDCGHVDPSHLKRCPCPTDVWKQAQSLHWGSTLQFARPPCGHCLLERCHHPRGGRQVWPPLWGAPAPLGPAQHGICEQAGFWISQVGGTGRTGGGLSRPLLSAQRAGKFWVQEAAGCLCLILLCPSPQQMGVGVALAQHHPDGLQW